MWTWLIVSVNEPIVHYQSSGRQCESSILLTHLEEMAAACRSLRMHSTVVQLSLKAAKEQLDSMCPCGDS